MVTAVDLWVVLVDRCVEKTKGVPLSECSHMWQSLEEGFQKLRLAVVAHHHFQTTRDY